MHILDSRYIDNKLTEALEQVCAKYLRPDSPTTSGSILADSTPGISVLGSINGKVVVQFQKGHSLRYADRDAQELPRDQWVGITKDSIFDLASVSKLFTTLAILKLDECGLVDIDSPVAKYLEDFANQKGKSAITIKHLLTHSSGFPPEPIPMLDSPKMRYLPVKDLKKSVVENACQHEPGTTYVYSGFIVEGASGTSLAEYVKKTFFDPLEMTTTFYTVPSSLYSQCTANEFSVPVQALGRQQPIRGVVHDEKAYLLRSTGAGHAGVFSAVNDLNNFGQMLSARGEYKGKSILKPATLAKALKDYNVGLPGKVPDPPKTASHGLGFELNQPWYMGELTKFDCFGHTGFTGTSIVVTQKTPSFLIILTNRTHPTRETGQINRMREECATVFSRFLSLGSVNSVEHFLFYSP